MKAPSTCSHAHRPLPLKPWEKPGDEASSPPIHIRLIKPELSCTCIGSCTCSAGVMMGKMSVQYSCRVQSSAISSTKGRTNGTIFLLRNSLLSAGSTRCWTIRCVCMGVGGRETEINTIRKFAGMWYNWCTYTYMYTKRRYTYDTCNNILILYPWYSNIYVWRWAMLNEIPMTLYMYM